MGSQNSQKLLCTHIHTYMLKLLIGEYSQDVSQLQIYAKLTNKMHMCSAATHKLSSILYHRHCRPRSHTYSNHEPCTRSYIQHTAMNGSKRSTH